MYLCGTLLQGLTRPAHADGALGPGQRGKPEGPWTYVNPGLRMYVDLTPALRSKLGRRYLLQVLPLADGRSAAVLPALLEDPRFRVAAAAPNGPRSKGAAADRSGSGRRAFHGSVADGLARDCSSSWFPR